MVIQTGNENIDIAYESVILDLSVSNYQDVEYRYIEKNGSYSGFLDLGNMFACLDNSKGDYLKTN